MIASDIYPIFSSISFVMHPNLFKNFFSFASSQKNLLKNKMGKFCKWHDISNERGQVPNIKCKRSKYKKEYYKIKKTIIIE